MAGRKVRIVFYRARRRLDSDVWPEAIYPVDYVLDAIEKRSAREGDAKYVSAGGNQLLGMRVPSDSPVVHLAIYRIRTDMLPEVELDGHITPLELAQNAKLADPSHWVFFGHNVVGTLATRDGPGKLQELAAFGRAHPELVPRRADPARDSLLAGAFADGRIAAASVDGWRAAFDADPIRTARTLSTLAAVAPRPAVASWSSVPAPSDGGFSEDQWATFMESIGLSGSGRRAAAFAAGPVAAADPPSAQVFSEDQWEAFEDSIGLTTRKGRAEARRRDALPEEDRFLEDFR